jgi:hypothetical protein
MEKSYAKSLKSWSKKWGDLIEKGEKLIDDAIALIRNNFKGVFASFVIKA